jgi:hypothetical protein
MSKSKILAEVDAMVSARLFGSGPWLSDPESCVALQRRLEQMGLEERVPSASDTKYTFGKGATLGLTHGVHGAMGPMGNTHDS